MNKLDVTVMPGNDTQITIKPTQKSDGLVPPWLSSAVVVVTLYDPATKAVIATKSGADILVTSTNITFTFTVADVVGLADGFYPWIAHLTAPGPLNYTVNNGDLDQTVGNLKIVNYP